MKYLIVRGPDGETPVLFSRSFLHRWVAGLLSPLPVVAAGFVAAAADGPVCYGMSAGLNIRSRPERDTALLREALADGAWDPECPSGNCAPGRAADA